MAQELHVLRCFSCDTFQSHIVKKTSKWECKMCGVKQSIKKVYGRGSGKDCRIHTQKLNVLKGQKEETESSFQQGKEINERAKPILINESLSSSQNLSKRTSKWAEFIDENETDVYQNHCTKRENITSPLDTSKSNVQKRKIRDALDHEKINKYPDDFDSAGSSSSVFSNTSSSGCTKKVKLNKNHIAENSSYNCYSLNNRVESGNCPSQRNTRKPINNKYVKSNFKNKTESKVDTKWGKYLESENMPENSSLNENIQPRDTKVSLKWRKYFDEEEGVISPETPSLKNTFKHKSESKVGMKLEECFKNGLQEESGMSCFQNSEHFCRESPVESFTVFSNDLGRVPSDDCGSISGYFGSNSENNENVNRSDYHSLRSDSYSSIKKICFPFESHNNESNISSDETLKYKFSKDIDKNFEEVSGQEKQLNSDDLPVFEQNCDISDIVFELDF